MNSANSLGSQDKNQSELIVSMSPLAFVLSCLGLAYANAVDLAQFPAEFLKIAHTLFAASWTFWAVIVVSLFMMLTFGLPSIRNLVAALIISIIGTLSILSMTAYQVNWLVMLILICTVLVPAGNVLFKKIQIK